MLRIQLALTKPAGSATLAAKGLSKAELARLAGISKAYLGALENPAHRTKPSADVLLRSAGALDTALAVLLGRTPRSGDEEVMIPAELRMLALEEQIPEHEVRMLASISWRGRRPRTQRDFWYLYEAIKRSCRE